MMNVTQSFHRNFIALVEVVYCELRFLENPFEDITYIQTNYHLNGIGTSHFCSGIKKTTILHVSLNWKINSDYPLTQIFLKMFKSQHFTTPKLTF